MPADRTALRQMHTGHTLTVADTYGTVFDNQTGTNFKINRVTRGLRPRNVNITGPGDAAPTFDQGLAVVGGSILGTLLDASALPVPMAHADTAVNHGLNLHPYRWRVTKRWPSLHVMTGPGDTGHRWGWGWPRLEGAVNTWAKADGPDVDTEALSAASIVFPEVGTIGNFDAVLESIQTSNALDGAGDEVPVAFEFQSDGGVAYTPGATLDLCFAIATDQEKDYDPIDASISSAYAGGDTVADDIVIYGWTIEGHGNGGPIQVELLYVKGNKGV